MTCPSHDAEQPSLFTNLEAPVKVPGRRNPPRKAAARQRELQVHLPIVQGEAAELLRMEDLVVSQRPLTRGDCEEEARPCPWVRCPKHLYYERFLEFEAIVDRIAEPLPCSPDVDGGCSLTGMDVIGPSRTGGSKLTSSEHPRAVCPLLEHFGCEDRDPVHVAVADALIGLFTQTEDDEEGKARRPKTPAAVATAVHGGLAMITIRKRGRVSSDVLTSTDVRGPWPTCSLDVAQEVADGSGELGAEDTARALAKTREAVRQIEARSRQDFARDPDLRAWLTDIVDEDRLDEFASGSDLDWYGDDDE